MRLKVDLTDGRTAASKRLKKMMLSKVISARIVVLEEEVPQYIFTFLRKTSRK